MTRAKVFESKIKEALEKIPNSYCQRLYDSAMCSNYPSDFIFYNGKTLYFIECKSLQKNTLNFNSAISNNQWDLMYNISNSVSNAKGIIIAWFVDNDVTCMFDINDLHDYKNNGKKSVRYDDEKAIIVPSIKKRTYFDYNLELLGGK